MKYSVLFNQNQCLKYGLSVNSAALMALLCELSSWADEKIINGKVYYYLSRNKVIEELPFFYSKPDTVYRNFKALVDLGMVEYMTEKKKDYLRLTTKGKGFGYHLKNSDLNPNSEMNPRKLGNESEFSEQVNSTGNQIDTLKNSDLNPTNKYYKYTKDKSAIEVLKKIEDDNPLLFNIIFNSEDFNDRIKSALKSYDLKFDFQKDVYPIYSKWLQQMYTANGLKISTSNVRVKLTAYVIAVMQNGGLGKSQFLKNNQPEIKPAYLKNSM